MPVPDGSGDTGEELAESRSTDDAAPSYDGGADSTGEESTGGERRQRRAQPDADLSAWESAVTTAIQNTGLVTSPITVSIEQPATSPYEITATVLGLTVPEKEGMLAAIAEETVSVVVNGETNTAYAWSFYLTTQMPTTERSYGIPDRETASIRLGVIAGSIAGGCAFGLLLLAYAQWIGNNKGVIDVRKQLDN